VGRSPKDEPACDPPIGGETGAEERRREAEETKKQLYQK